MENNVFKVGASLKVGPYKAGGEAKAGTYSVQMDRQGNPSFSREETLTTAGAGTSGNLRETKGMGINSDNQAELSVKIGEGSLTLGAELDKLSETISYGLEAVRAYTNNLFTDLTNNAFGTDSKMRTQGQYMEQEKMH